MRGEKYSEILLALLNNRIRSNFPEELLWSDICGSPSYPVPEGKLISMFLGLMIKNGDRVWGNVTGARVTNLPAGRMILSRNRFGILDVDLIAGG